MTAQLVTTSVAARALTVHPTTLTRWWREGIVKPAAVTAGGHARWDVESLQAQIRAYQGEEPAPLPPSAPRFQPPAGRS